MNVRERSFERAGNIVLFLLTVAVICFVHRHYIFSSFLFSDDNIYLSRSVLGHAVYPPPGIAGYWLISLTGMFGSLAFIKFTNILFFGLLAVFIAVNLSLAGVRRAISFVAALWIASFPITVSQAFFVTGAHPLAGTVGALAGLYAFRRAIDLPGRNFILGMAISFSLCVLALLFSPTMILMPMAPIIWIAIAFLFRRMTARRALAIGTAGVFLGTPASYAAMTQHHYNAISGWVNISAQTILNNLLKSFSTILHQFSNDYISAGYGFLVTAVIIIVVVTGLRVQKAKSAKINPNDLEKHQTLLFLFLGLATAAMAFGPSSINTQFTDRYAFAPFVLAATAFCGLLAYVYGRTQILSLIAIFVVLVGFNFLQRIENANGKYHDFLAAEQAFAKIIASESPHWPQNAQVLLLGRGPIRTTIGGYNHWSAWYLRGHTKRLDLIGVVGLESQVSGDPFIGEYPDYAPQFWHVVNGRAARRTMIGLESERPLFAYRSSPTDGAFEKVSVAFDDGETVFVVAPGVAPRDAAKAANGQARCPQPTAAMYVWPFQVSLSHSAAEIRPDAPPPSRCR